MEAAIDSMTRAFAQSRETDEKVMKVEEKRIKIEQEMSEEKEGAEGPLNSNV